MSTELNDLATARLIWHYSLQGILAKNILQSQTKKD